MKRVIVTLSIPEEMDTHDLALELDAGFPDSDSTVWATFEDFFDDVDDGVITRDHDGTLSEEGQ